MKTKFEDLTRDQILSLTDDDIRYYTDYRLAENGVVLPPHPGDAPEQKDFPEPTELAFECRGILVADIEEAKLIATLESVVETNYDGDYNYKYLIDDRGYHSGIEKKKFYKKEELAKFKGDLKEYNKEKSNYNSDLSAYNKAVKESESITAFITDICYKVSVEDRYINSAKARYEELLELAQGSEQIAYNFFIKAYPVETTSQKLEDFYTENSTTGTAVLSYEEFAKRCGVELPEEDMKSE